MNIKRIIFTALSVVAIACLLGGCSANRSKESLRVVIHSDPPVSIEYDSEVIQRLVAYYTKTKQIEHITPFSSTCVGEIEGQPDSEAIEASGGFFGALIKAIITK